MANKSQKIKELTPVQSYAAVKDLLKERKSMTTSDLVPGNLVFTFYDAKYKEFTYDRTPLALILKRSSKYTLVLNFHWLPLKMRINLIKHIILMNKKNVKKNLPLTFSYSDLKPMLKSLGYAPCIRLYINNRIGRTGVIIPPDRLIEVARLRTETFTNGKYSAEYLYSKARKSKK